MTVQKAARRISLATILVVATAMVSGQGQTPNRTGTIFRATTNFVTTDVIVRDKAGKFIPDLKPADFKVYEDGVLQKIAVFRALVGGRPTTTLNGVAEAAPVASEGLILPRSRPATDTSGRIFIIFIDEKHFTALETPKVREVLRQIRDNLIHDNDLVGFVSTGTTAVAVNPSYDYEHRRFNEVIDKIVGMAPKPDDYINEAWFEGTQGPVGLRQAASQAFITAYDMIQQLSSIVDRRKSFIYVSNGYTFDPFTDARYKRIQEQYEEYSFQDSASQQPDANGNMPTTNSNGELKQSERTPDDPMADPRYRERTMWKESELLSELAELTRDARRANVVFYTMDARGLITGMDAGQVNKIEYQDMRRFIDTQANSLKVLAEETGGFATVGTNNFKGSIERIDAETSDSYTIGYTSSNPDPFKIRRTIKIEVSRPDTTLIYRPDYTIPRPRR